MTDQNDPRPSDELQSIVDQLCTFVQKNGRRDGMAMCAFSLSEAVQRLSGSVKTLRWAEGRQRDDA